MPAVTLTKGRRKLIADYKSKNPDISVASISAKFGATPSQVNYAINMGKRGRITKKSTKKVRNIEANLLKNKKGVNEIFADQIHYSIAQLAAHKNYEPIDRINMLEKIARAQKIQNEYEMQVHLKGIDWKIYCETVRRFKPDATEKEIIKIFNELKELCRINSVD